MSKNCPFCPPDNQNETWGLSPEGMEAARKKHEDEHCFKCPTCGHLIQKENTEKQIIEMKKSENEEYYCRGCRKFHHPETYDVKKYLCKNCAKDYDTGHTKSHFVPPKVQD